MTETPHIHVCKFARGLSAHAGIPNGCVCDCGAVFHILGWQEIRVLTPSEMPLHSHDPAKDGMVRNPCALIMDDGELIEFNVKEYRADLERRLETLWTQVNDATDSKTASRILGKARGIEIAMSLLPKAR